MIAIIDYDAGNLKSVEKALIALGEEVIVSRDSSEILQADKVILPGVGSFGDAMNNLDRFGLVDTIKNVVANANVEVIIHIADNTQVAAFLTPRIIIDEINIRQATSLAMHNAVKALNPGADYVIIDGNDKIAYDLPYEYIIKGDAKSQTIAAASILAKVSRDRLMCALDEKYPEYCFKKHTGYGTKLHMEMIRKYGVSDIHRKTFITDKVLGK